MNDPRQTQPRPTELIRPRREATGRSKPVRWIALARITMPRARVHLSAGRQRMSGAVQALCFRAGANSIFYGDKLLTTGNPAAERDRALFAKLGVNAAEPAVRCAAPHEPMSGSTCVAVAAGE